MSSPTVEFTSYDSYVELGDIEGGGIRYKGNLFCLLKGLKK